MEKSSQETTGEFGFYELFGMDSSYSEIQSAARTLDTFSAAFSPQYTDGKLSAIVYAHLTKAESSQFIGLMSAMKINPWIEHNEDGTSDFVLEDTNDISRFLFFNKLSDEDE